MTLLLRMHGSLSSALWIYDLRFTICCCGDWVSEFMVSGQPSAISLLPLQNSVLTQENAGMRIAAV
jgi:hypothetical protein